ncbi:MAG: hypothetical protein ACRC8S_15260 [Fimbriiglobus sp.]
MLRLILASVSLLGFVAVSLGQERVELIESFKADRPIRVELATTLVGRLALPDRKNERGGKPEVITVQGESKLRYDEVLLPRDPEKNLVILRQYQDVSMKRTLGMQDQKAELRSGIMRMVVLRSEKGKKVPFSPDGPLTLGEIDIVRADLFSPVLVTGLLPAQPATIGNKWAASSHAIVELTDYETIEKNDLTVELLAFPMIDGRKHAKLGFSGQVRGLTEDGASIQTFTGTGYFDLERKIFASLNLTAKNQQLGPDGKTVNGEVTGTFIVRRSPATNSVITPEMVRTLDTKPTDARTELLYEDATIGVRITYPRSWRLSQTDARTISLEDRDDTGTVAITRLVEPLPINKAIADAKEFVAKQKWTVLDASIPKTDASGLTRFTLKVQNGTETFPLEYAVRPELLATARIRPKAPATTLTQVEALFQAMQPTK